MWASMEHRKIFLAGAGSKQKLGMGFKEVILERGKYNVFAGLLDPALYLSCSWIYVLSTVCLLVAVLFNFCNLFIV